MITILPVPDHVAAFRIEGTLTAQDYDTVVPEDALRRVLQYGLDKHGSTPPWILREKGFRSSKRAYFRPRKGKKP